MMIRRTLISLVAVATALLFAPGGSADRPAMQLIPTTEDFTVFSCEFPVLVHTDQQHATYRVFTNRAGNVVRETVTGVIKITLTNTDPGGRSVSLNISGPEHVRHRSDGSLVFRGVGPWIFFGGYAGSATDGIVYHVGQLKFVSDAEGNLLDVVDRGRSVEICNKLAPAS